MSKQFKPDLERESIYNVGVFCAFSENYGSFSVEKPCQLSVATKKESKAKSNNIFFGLWMLIGLLSLQLFALSQLPKMITVFQEVVFEESKPTWVRK